MISTNEILVTGGNGMLATELKKHINNGYFLDRNELDVTDTLMVANFFESHKISLVIHTAAFLPPMKCQQEPAFAIKTNIIGTGVITMECIKRNIKLFYISSDYVFKGDKGNYSEEDSLYPVNAYAWSKLGGECCVRMYPNSLIIRTSFGPAKFPYEKAFDDQYTSRESVDVIASKIVSLIDSDVTGVIHLGGERKTVYEYAKGLSGSENVMPQSIADLKTDYVLPKDTSLNTEKFRKLRR